MHDWHAEVLAIRAFNRFLVDECKALALGQDGSGWVRWRRREEEDVKEEELEGGIERPFELEEGVGVHMYCSEAPCGDASMELVMRSQEDDTPWTSQVQDGGGGGGAGGMLGRGHFDQLGIVRRKPSRPDAPLSASKSCSDKIAMKQVTGLLSGLASLLLHERGLFLDTLVLPESQYVEEAVERAFGVEGRMKGLEKEKDLMIRPFEVKTTTKEFEFSRRVQAEGEILVPSNLSALYTPLRQEVLINGVLLGRKQFDVKGASCVSRRVMWKSVLVVAGVAGSPALVDVLRTSTYRGVKDSAALRWRREAKRRTIETALQGWERNAQDHDWGLDG